MKNLSFSTWILLLLLYTALTSVLFVSCAWEEGSEECHGGDWNIPFPNVMLGTHATGNDLLQDLQKKAFLVDALSAQALSHPDFPISKDRSEVAIVVLSLRDMEFTKNELVTLDDIIERGKKCGLLPCPPEVAVQIRLQFAEQPDRSDNEFLSEFFVATEAINVYSDGIPRIFNIVRDDTSPHQKTGIGLWIISSKLSDALDKNQDRLFDPSNPRNRFAFIYPLDPLPEEKDNTG